MKTTIHAMATWTVAGILAGAGLLLAGGCAGSPGSPGSPGAPGTPLETQPEAEGPARPDPAQPVFDSDDALAAALLAAVKAQDHQRVHELLGPAWKQLVSGDKVEDADAFKEFAALAAEQTRLEKQDATTSILHVGHDDGPLAIPLVKTPEGKWFLDAETGKARVLERRIGGNELNAIQVCRVYVEAQRAYAARDRDGTDVRKYAQRVLSTPGKTDGLYWDLPVDQEQSPLADLIAREKLEGYSPAPGRHEPYHGYHFRVLKRQGPSAPGGAYDYVINGNMVAGFALVAFPVDYEASGIMTFIVNQRGKVYQKDLGPDSTALGRHMTAYDPDGSWTLVKD